MKKIPFDTADFPAISSGVKNLTLRTSKETERYSPGDVCQVISYASNVTTAIRIRINSVILTSARKLAAEFKDYDLAKLGEDAVERNIPVAVVRFTLISP